MILPHKFKRGDRVIDKRGKIGTVIGYEHAWTVFATVEFDNGITHRMYEDNIDLYYDQPSLD